MVQKRVAVSPPVSHDFVAQWVRFQQEGGGYTVWGSHPQTKIVGLSRIAWESRRLEFGTLSRWNEMRPRQSISSWQMMQIRCLRVCIQGGSAVCSPILLSAILGYQLQCVSIQFEECFVNLGFNGDLCLEIRCY